MGRLFPVTRVEISSELGTCSLHPLVEGESDEHRSSEANFCLWDELHRRDDP